MADVELNDEDLAALAILADGIIPPDRNDRGAASVNAGPRLAEKIRSGVNTELYRDGLQMARQIAEAHYVRPTSQLTEVEVHDLIAELRRRTPEFFKQLRMDVCALYLADADVWARIGFPGPSFEDGGYPDFDQPQC